MIVTYLRSSSYSSWDMCQQQYFLQYPLGIYAPPSKKTTLGSIVHKALELLAKKKLAIQREQVSFVEDEMGHTYDTDQLTIERCVEDSFEYYSEKESHIKWENADLRQAMRWTEDTLAMSNGIWNPLKRNIVEPEKYFDITFEEPWAHYKYTLPNGQELEGQLSIKGTSDLVTEIDKDTLEVVDWKTGKRKDWANDKIKDWTKLRRDPQLSMYFYALAKLYPQYKYIIMSIVFIQDGTIEGKKGGTPNRGSFSMPYDKDIDMKRTEDMIRKRFETIRASQRPKLRKSWRCGAFCHMGRTKWKDTDKTICEHFEMEMQRLGMNGVIREYTDVEKLTQYGSGGGRSSENEKARSNASLNNT